MDQRRGARSLLRRNPGFARLYTAHLVSIMGDWFALVALLGLVLDTSGRPADAGLLLALETLPLALASPLAGVIADRLDRRRIMVASEGISAALALGFLLGGPSRLWVGFACLAGISLCAAFFAPASSASIPNLVAREDLATANALMGSAWGTMMAIGSALGGAVAATAGREAAFVGDAISFVVAGALIAGIRGRFRAEGTGERRGPGVVRELREALTFVRSERRLAAVLAIKAGQGIAGGSIVLLSVFPVKVFGTGDGGIGLLMGARGAGALTGPLLFRRFLRESDRVLFGAMAVALGVFGAGYAAFGLAPGMGLAAAGAFVGHLGAGAQWSLSSYGIQRFAPDEIRGRIFAFDFALIMVSISASFWVTGIAAEHVHPRAVALALAALGTAWTIVWAVATRSIRRAPAREAAGA